MVGSRARVTVSGYVQGVGFRYAVLARARSLQVGGWVRNRHDGRVEAVFEGDENRVESMVDWCRRGPAHSRHLGFCALMSFTITSGPNCVRSMNWRPSAACRR